MGYTVQEMHESFKRACKFYSGAEFLAIKAKNLLEVSAKLPVHLDYVDWAELYADYVVEYEKRMDELSPAIKTAARMSIAEFTAGIAGMYPENAGAYLKELKLNNSLANLLGGG